ncbi:MAG: D-2-hydroxyacid dehydrogenase [Chloroflexota bacterium]
MLAIPISEWVTMVMLMFAKNMPAYLDLKKEKKWQRLSGNLLYGKTAGVVGLGHIGIEVAKRAKALGMRIMATKRSAKPGQRTRYADELVTTAQLPRLLAESDYVVITLPYTAETHHMFGEKELRAMKPTARILNIGRGKIIDEEVLIRALEERWIAGAGLDVFDTEPLSPESKLWGMPNVIQTPHASGSWEGSTTAPTDLFIDNLKRYVTGKRLINRVDKKKGY